MRTEGLRRTLVPALLILTLVLSTAFISTPVRAAAVISYPGHPSQPQNIFPVTPGQTFTLRHRLAWDDPANPGFYLVAIYWDYLDPLGTPDNAYHFTLENAVAYFDNNGDNLPDPGVAMIDNTVSTKDNETRYSITVKTAAGDWRLGTFNVDITLRASGPDGTHHVGTDNHPIYYTILQSLEAFPPAAVVPGPVTLRVLGRNVDVAISPPDYQSGPPGATLSYTVTVTNTGAFDDDYDLSTSDDAIWGPTLDNYLFENIQPGKNRTTTLSVTVPLNAVYCTEDNILVIATSQADTTVSDNDSCIAHAEEVKPKVEVSISENYQSSPAGTMLSYRVSVKNTGNIVDNYILTVSDTENWGLSLPENRFENVAPGQVKTTTLDVTIPETAVPCTEDNIRVTATSLTDNVENSASTIAHAIERGVEVTISPGWQTGGPDYNIWGEYDLAYTVRITNRGPLSDNFYLDVRDNLGWDLWLPGFLLEVAAGENRSLTLYVKVPTDAEPHAEDTIIITVTSWTDSSVINRASCVAQSGVVALEVSISPSRQSGEHNYDLIWGYDPISGEPNRTDYDLAYTVTVTNNGTIVDTYTLTATDNAGWDMGLWDNENNITWENFLTVSAGESINTTLYVRVPLLFDAEPGTEDFIVVTATSQADNRVSDSASCIARAAIVDFEVTISPSYQIDSPGEDLVYTVTVKNTGDGAQPKEHKLYISDTAGWEPTLDDNLENIPSGVSWDTNLRVTIPDDATHNIRNNLTVEVRALWSQMGKWVENENIAIAHAETLRLFISPDVDSAGPGENLTFAVVVTNVGIESDNYILIASDDADWQPSFSENSLNNIAPGEWRVTTLRVAIPENAIGGTEDNIMVTVIPGADPAASESENCIAIAAPPREVMISVSPKSRVGSGGAKLTYAIVVIGAENDNYDLTVSDSENWGLTLSENLLVNPGVGRRSTILEVAIPGDAVAGTVDNMIVTVTSRENAEVSASASCAVKVELPAAIVRGDSNAYNIDAKETVEEGDDPPEVWYEAGDYPPLMAARRVGEGAVVAAGTAATARDTRWNPVDSRTGEPLSDVENFDVLLDMAFQWMKPGATNVLWYEGYEVYNDTDGCSELVAALEALGYTVKGDNTEPITANLLSPYDILIMPQFELPPEPFSSGGDPSLLLDSDVEAIKDFVEGGGGLLVVDGSDSPYGYNFYRVQNKILRGLGIYDISFQSDSVHDPVLGLTGREYQFDAEVTLTDFGADYQEATGSTHVMVYSTSSLIVEPGKKERDVSLSISPSYLEDLPGETLTYTLTITNTGRLDDAYVLDAVDNAGFASSVSPQSVWLENGASDNVTLSVTIPEGTPRGMESRITIAVTSLLDSTLGDVAYGEAWTGALGVSASIDPTSKSGLPGENLKFIVYVKNTGDFEDNYTLAVSDNAAWEPTISPDNLTIPGGRTKFAILSVIIPENAANGAEDNITITVTSQTDSGVSAEKSATAHVEIVRGVDVLISPASQSGAPGEELNFDVTITNTGKGTDTFSLTSSDTEVWGSTLSITLIPSLAEGASRTGIRLSIKIPDNVIDGDSTVITVTATSQIDPNVRDSDSSIAHAAIVRGVGVSISPSENSGVPKATLTFTITVTNTGNAEDTYDLTVSDDAEPSWGPTLDHDLLTIPAGESRTTTVGVIVPSDAVENDSTMITVNARSQADQTVENSAWCRAKAVAILVGPPGPPIVPIGVGGAAIAGGVAVTLLLKKGMISSPFLRSRRRRVLRMDLTRSRPSKRKFSKKWL